MGPKVGFYYWVRVGVMILSLIGSIMLMRKLSKPGALGGVAATDSVDICPTRVSSVSVIGRFAIMQDGMNWYRTGGPEGRTELDPVAVEKWFAANCRVNASKEGTNAGASPLMTLAYVSGLPMTLLVNGDGIFSLNGTHFRSGDLSQGINELENLPPVAKPGQKHD